MKEPLVKGAFIGSSISPIKLTVAMFFAFKVLSFILSLVILFDSLSVRLLVDPAALVSEISSLISIDSLLLASAGEIAGVVIDEKSLSEVWFEVVSDLTLIVASEVSVFFEPIDLHISLRQLIGKLGFSVDIDQVVGVPESPHFVIGRPELG